MSHKMLRKCITKVSILGYFLLLMNVYCRMYIITANKYSLKFNCEL